MWRSVVAIFAGAGDGVWNVVRRTEILFSLVLRYDALWRRSALVGVGWGMYWCKVVMMGISPVWCQNHTSMKAWCSICFFIKC